MNAELKFDEPSHTYSVGDRILPGVTGILKDVGLIDDRFYNTEAMWRGTHAHTAIRMMLDGTLDRDDLDPQLAGYVDSAYRFAHDVGFNALCLEVRRHDPVRGYAGTLDAVGTCGALSGVVVIDWKSGARNKAWHPLQTAAYVELVKDDWDGPIHRASVHLKADGGKPDFWLHDDESDRPDFFAALRVSQRLRRVNR